MYTMTSFEFAPDGVETFSTVADIEEYILGCFGESVDLVECMDGRVIPSNWDFASSPNPTVYARRG